MSKLYAVVQICPERHYDYKMDTMRESFSVGLPFVFSDRKRAYQEAEKKRKAHVPCFVKEFPFNPLDKRLETLEAKAKADADYIKDLEQSVEKLEAENARLRSCLSDDKENAREIMGENEELRDALEKCVILLTDHDFMHWPELFDETMEQVKELGIKVSQ